MLTKIEILQAQLEAEIQREKENQKHIKLAEASRWIGKCYSTHTFKRVPKYGTSVVLRKITSVEYIDDVIYYVGTNVTFNIYDNDLFNLSINNSSKSDSPFSHWMANFSHEISEGSFNTILENVKAHAESYFDTIRPLLKQDEYVTQGDSTGEFKKYQYLKRYNSFVKLPIDVKDILVYEYHPYIFNYNELLDTKESFEIIKDIANKLRENAISWGGSIYSRDYPRSEILLKYYNQHILKFK